MKVSWSLLLLFCLVCGLQFSAANYEDAKKLVSSFKSIVDSPVAKDLKLFLAFAGSSALFLRRVVPFGEFMATASKNTVDEDKLDNLLKLTNGISTRLTDVQKQLRYIVETPTFRSLLGEYERDIVNPLFGLLDQISAMSSVRMNVSEVVINTFVSDCNNANTSPRQSARHMARIASKCVENRLDAALVSRLYTFINGFSYDNYDLDEKSKHLFHHRLTILYFHLTFHTSRKFSTMREFRRENKGRNFADKPQMLLALMMKLKLDDEDQIEIDCIPFAAFQRSGYRSDAITRFGSTFTEHYYCLLYTTAMCANISFYGHPQGADVFTRTVEERLEPVTKFIDEWFVQTIESTWPETEQILVQNIMSDYAKETDIPENNATYTQLVTRIYNDMEPVGHSGYARQYIVTRAWTYGTTSRYFGFGCKPGSCTVATAMNARCTMLRVQTSTNRTVENLQDLLDFSNTSFPTFFDAMKTKFYSYFFVDNVVDKLGKNYGLYLNHFNNHSSFVILRYFEYSRGCANTYAVKSTEDLDSTFVQTWTYHTDGALTTNCEHWNVFLTN